MKGNMRWGRLILLTAALLTFFFIGRNAINSAREELSRQETELRVSLADLREENTDLELEIEHVGTQSYIESVAREEYEYIMPGELRFEVTNPDALELTEDEAKFIAAEMADY